MKRSSPLFIIAMLSLGVILLWRFFGVSGDEVLQEVRFPGALNQLISPHVYVITAAYILLYASVWFMIWLKVGREYSSLPVFENAATALPPVRRSPALVAYLVNQGEVGGSSYAATILYLAQKKMIRIETGEKNIIYFQPEKCTEEVGLIDRLVFTNLMTITAGNDFVTYDDVISAMKERPQDMRHFYTSWRKAIGQRAQELGFFEKTGTSARTIFYTVTFFFTIPLLMLLDMGKIVGNDDAFFPTTWFLIIYVNFMYFLGKAFMRWSRERAEEVGGWIAFKRYISGVSRLKREGIESWPVWEEILIYATALGCAKKVDKALPLIVKPDSENPSLETFLLGRYV